MTKFNLNTLPKCGAKTRSGEPCKRFGNKLNGRCKLHGGRSTGAKTKEGKLAVKLNPVVNAFIWFFNTHFNLSINKNTVENAVNAYLELVALSKQNMTTNISQQIIAIVKEYRTELENLKYYIAEYDGANALLLIQSALDHFYKNSSSKHLYFHVYTSMYPTPYFHKMITKTQLNMMVKTEGKTNQKYGCHRSHNIKPSEEMRQLKKLIKDLNNT